MKTYATLAVARMQSGVLTKKTGEKHSYFPAVAGAEEYLVGTEGEISSFIAALNAKKEEDAKAKKPRKAPELVGPPDLVRYSGKVLFDNGKFICLNIHGGREWFNYKQLDTLVYELDCGERTASLTTIYPLGKRDLRGRPRTV